ncbi:hypothetical protein [Brevibacillus agri]|nr:hypothetical protein [Brevibacillus agri]MED3498318.1 hypothetical protein [Brevibacillus agri]
MSTSAKKAGRPHGAAGYSYTLIVLTAPFEQKMMLEEEKIF